MNRNTIIGLLVIFGLMLAYSLYMRPSKEELAVQQRLQDSIAMAQQKYLDSLELAMEQQQAELEEKKAMPQEILGDEKEEEVIEQIIEVDRDKLGAFANASVPQNNQFVINNDVLQIIIDQKGGKIISAELTNYKTYDSLPLVLFDPESVEFGFTFFANNRLINTDELYFQPFWYSNRYAEKSEMNITGEETLKFGMRLYTSMSDSSFNTNQYIEYLYTFKGNDYLVDFAVNFVGLEEIIASSSRFLDMVWQVDLNQLEKSVDRFNGSTIYYKYYNDDVNYLSETKDDEESLKTRVKWISYKQRFFCSSIIAEEFLSNADISAVTYEEKAGDHYLKTMRTEVGIEYNSTPSESVPMHFLFSPLKYKTLRKYDLELERQIPLGWSFFLLAWINRYAVIPVFDFLSGFGWNYGIIILVLTVLLKLLLFPIAYKTYTSQAKMRVLKPEIEEIGNKYPKKEDAMKKQKATMDLYKKAGVNPMAGCIPMLLQFPILIAMFRFFPSSIELRQQSFLWATDLSSYDSILDLPFNIPFYGDHVSLFTLLMTVSTLIYTRLNNQMMSTGQQIQGMKTMMYLMPIMFLGFFNSYASALSYYYLLANIFTFTQMYLFRAFVNEDKIRAKIEANKKKPRKKSGFQKRLEEAAKQRGYNPNTRRK